MLQVICLRNGMCQDARAARPRNDVEGIVPAAGSGGRHRNAGHSGGGMNGRTLARCVRTRVRCEGVGARHGSVRTAVREIREMHGAAAIVAGSVARIAARAQTRPCAQASGGVTARDR